MSEFNPKPKDPKPAAILLCILGVIAALWYRGSNTPDSEPFYDVDLSPKEVHQLIKKYRSDPSQKHILKHLVAIAKSGRRFTRNYTIGSFSDVAKAAPLTDECWTAIFDGLWRNENSTMRASTRALGGIQPQTLPHRVQMKLAAIVTRSPVGSVSRDALRAMQNIPAHAVAPEVQIELRPILEQRARTDDIGSDAARVLLEKWNAADTSD